MEMQSVSDEQVSEPQVCLCICMAWYAVVAAWVVLVVVAIRAHNRRRADGAADAAVAVAPIEPAAAQPWNRAKWWILFSRTMCVCMFQNWSSVCFLLHTGMAHARSIANARLRIAWIRLQVNLCNATSYFSFRPSSDLFLTGYKFCGTAGASARDKEDAVTLAVHQDILGGGMLRRPKFRAHQRFHK
jgi:hypothetical protein